MQRGIKNNVDTTKVGYIQPNKGLQNGEKVLKNK